MMDKELIAMCNCPEIQDRWVPQIGDRMILNNHSYEHGNICLMVARETLHLRRKDYLYIPRIEDVLEWLGEEEFTISSPVANDGGTNWSIEVTPSPSQMPSHLDYTEYSGILIKALLKAYMHLEHNKTWNGEAWA